MMNPCRHNKALDPVEGIHCEKPSGTGGGGGGGGGGIPEESFYHSRGSFVPPLSGKEPCVRLPS